jgi:hypothetical protein
MLEREDSKAGRLLTIFGINSAVVSFVGSLAKDGLASAPFAVSFSYSLLVVVYFIIASTLLLFALQASIYPHTNPFGPDSQSHKLSLSFFGDILKRKHDEYVEIMDKIELEEMVLDNASQTYILAGILKYKTDKMTKAAKLTPAMFLLLVVSVVLGILIFWQY